MPPVNSFLNHQERLMINIQSKWLRLSEETNAFDYLERAAGFIRETEQNKTEQNKLAWKWVVLSLHSALYGFAICACKGTNNDNVTTKTKKGDRPLISFHNAIERCQDPACMRMLMHSQPLVLSTAQKESIRLLKKELRNPMEHYVPMGWSIEIHCMPQIAIDVLDVIRFLAVDTRTRIHLTQEQIKKIKSLVFQSKKFLKKSKLYQEILRKEGNQVLQNQYSRSLRSG
jgi:hypothetical protein